MSRIIDFYRGEITDHVGRYLRDYRNFTVAERESIHDYIQWMFPNMEASAFNAFAPLLTLEDIELFKVDANLRRAARVMTNDMYAFYKNNTSIWVTPNNHNCLRITRILKFLSAIELTAPYRTCSEVEHFFDLVSTIYEFYPEIIGSTTMQFWREACAYKPQKIS